MEISRTFSYLISGRIDFHDSENSVRGRLLDRVRSESGIRKSPELETQPLDFSR